ncbi:MAG: hypothetical protein KJZ83_17280 [Burkholderiaceae bacterium]|nr:hypothetical protein [Burkholderiaceae bacterium]
MRRPIEFMTLRRDAMDYLCASAYGAGSPQAKCIQILRGMEMERGKNSAKKLAHISIVEDRG